MAAVTILNEFNEILRAAIEQHSLDQAERACQEPSDTALDEAAGTDPDEESA